VSRRRGRPASSSTDDTVAAVLAAARALFAAHGYAATSIRAIAEAAGLTHTAIYNHFGSKAQLFTAVFIDVQGLLIAELDRSRRAESDEPLLPRVLLDALESLRATDPRYVEFLASMYVEVHRHPGLQDIFRDGPPFPIVDVLRDLAKASDPAAGDAAAGDTMWFWVAFALGLAQLSALADEDTFASTVGALRGHPVPGGTR
jgi:AcrR family transcriptional regulator